MILSKKANNKGADQTERMRRLVCTCVVRKPPKTDFLAPRPSYSLLCYAPPVIFSYLYTRRNKSSPTGNFLMDLTLSILMDCPIHIKPTRMGVSIWYFKGSKLVISQIWCISVPDYCFYHNFQSRPWFWVFTVYLNTRLGVSSIQRVNAKTFIFEPRHVISNNVAF